MPNTNMRTAAIIDPLGGLGWAMLQVREEPGGSGARYLADHENRQSMLEMIRGLSYNADGKKA